MKERDIQQTEGHFNPWSLDSPDVTLTPAPSSPFPEEGVSTVAPYTGACMP